MFYVSYLLLHLLLFIMIDYNVYFFCYIAFHFYLTCLSCTPSRYLLHCSPPIPFTTFSSPHLILVFMSSNSSASPTSYPSLPSSLYLFSSFLSSLSYLPSPVPSLHPLSPSSPSFPFSLLITSPCLTPSLQAKK